MSEETGSWGCESCWPQEASRAYDAFLDLEVLAKPVDASHVEARFSRCSDCGQTFVAVWTEMVNFSGPDSMAWRVVPVTSDEHSELDAAGDSVLGELKEFAPSRRTLRRWSTDEKGTAWSDGFTVLPHD